LGNDIDKGADTAFERKEFVQHDYFLLFEDTIAALEIAPLIAYDVFCLVQDPLDLIECRLCILHTVLFKVTT
jgi:hypothetical protein